MLKLSLIIKGFYATSDNNQDNIITFIVNRVDHDRVDQIIKQLLTSILKYIFALNLVVETHVLYDLLLNIEFGVHSQFL